MEQISFDTKDGLTVDVDSKGMTRSWHEEARAWMSQQPAEKTGGGLAQVADSRGNLEQKAAENANATTRLEQLRPQAQEYKLLTRLGIDPVLIADVLTVASDLRAVAASPEGRKLFEDVKKLVSHLRA